MNFKKLFALLFLQLFFINYAFANVFNSPKDIEYIIKQIPVLKDIECKFKQEKYIKSSNLKLNSSGDFTFKKDTGITFYTTYPIKVTTSYKNSEYKQINNIISALTNKKYEKLKKDFDFYFRGDSNNWNLGLKTKDTSSIKDYLISIEIFGSDYISKMIIITADNVETTIWFIK